MLFYIVYANDILKFVNVREMALYADDTVLFTANKDFHQSVTKLQEDLNSSIIWCHNNGIMANTDSTKIMVFGSPCVLGKLPQVDIKIRSPALGETDWVFCTEVAASPRPQATGLQPLPCSFSTGGTP